MEFLDLMRPEQVIAYYVGMVICMASAIWAVAMLIGIAILILKFFASAFSKRDYIKDDNVILVLKGKDWLSILLKVVFVVGLVYLIKSL